MKLSVWSNCESFLEHTVSRKFMRRRKENLRIKKDDTNLTKNMNKETIFVDEDTHK